MEAALRAAGVQPRTDLEIGSREAIRQAVARSLGLGAVSEAEFIADPRFVPVRIAGEPASTATYVYCMAERADSVLISVVSERHLGQDCEARRTMDRMFSTQPSVQLASACSARAVMSSTLPVPLILRYLGAAAGSLAAHWL